MDSSQQQMIRQVYADFNARNIDEVLLHFHPDVRWPNGWEGGYVQGHTGVREYWTRQWKELDPKVEPTGYRQKDDGVVEVEVHQCIRDLQGNVLFDGTVWHLYTFEDNFIKAMEIKK